MTNVTVIVLLTAALLSAGDPDSAQFKRITPAAGIIGLIEPPDLTAVEALATSPAWTFHALVRTPARRDALIDQARAKGLSARFSATVWTGSRLPVAHRLLSAVIAYNEAGVPAAELQRVAAPLGLIATVAGGRWTYAAVPMPPELDDWPQWRHDAGRSRSSRDTLVGPSDILHWEAGAVHGEIASLAADGVLVSIDRGRNNTAIFRGYNAFSGAALWQRDTITLANNDQTWKTTADWTSGERVGFAASTHRGRLFIASEPVTVLDLQTGRDSTPLPEGANVARIWGLGDSLIVVGTAQLAVHDATTLAPRWRQPVRAFDLVAVGDHAIYLDIAKSPYELVARSLRSGDVAWRMSLAEWWVADYAPKWGDFNPANATRKGGVIPPIRIMWATPGRVLVRSAKDDGHLLCLDPATGKQVWHIDQREIIPRIADLPPMNFYDKQTAVPTQMPTMAGVDMMVLAGNRIWYPLNRSGGRRRIAVDLTNGTLAAQTDNISINENCQLAYGTSRMACFKDNSWIDALTGKSLVNEWNNPIGNNHCEFHAVPAYGLTNFGPKDCNCSAVGNGLRAAMDLAQAADPFLSGSASASHPSERGSAAPPVSTVPATWPTFMGSPRRLSAATASFTAAPRIRWEQRVATATTSAWMTAVAGGDALTQPVMDATRTIVIDAEAGRVVALDRATGRELWSRVVGGRVWASATLVDGRCIVGSDDGWVTALDLRDGGVCWRTRAAPAERLIATHGRLTSAWPITESALPVDGGVIVVAGRLANSAAGCWGVHLDTATGAVRWSRRWFRGLPTLSDNGMLYTQSNLRQPVGFGGAVLRPSDGVTMSSKKDSMLRGFLMQHQSAQPAVSRIKDSFKDDKAFAPAARDVDGKLLYVWAKPEKREPFLYCMSLSMVNPAHRDTLFSQTFNALVPEFTKESIWSKPQSGFGTVTAVVAVPDGVLVGSGPLPVSAPAKDARPQAATPRTGMLRLLAAADGAERWAIALPSPVSQQGLAVDAGGIVATLADGRVVHLGK